VRRDESAKRVYVPAVQMNPRGVLAMSLWKETRCPVCHGPGAQKFLWMVRCPRRGCPKYDPACDAPDAARGETAGRQAGAAPAAVLTGTFDPGPNRIDIRYRNYLGEEKTFVGDRTTLRLYRTRVSLRLVPTGRRCSLGLDRILNRGDVEAQIPPVARLPATDRQIYAYHTARGTTSPRFEEIRNRLAAGG
jgi:hypothetical protein